MSFAARKAHWKDLHAVGTTDRQRAIRNADQGEYEDLRREVEAYFKDQLIN